MDFGIARAMDDMGATMTQTSAVIGTAQYLSPEQARGRAGRRAQRPLLHRVPALRAAHRPAAVRRGLAGLGGLPARAGGAGPAVPDRSRTCRPPSTPWCCAPWPRTASSATRAPTRCAATSPRRAPAGRSRRSYRRAQPTQAMSQTTVLPGTATIPPVGSGPGAHRGGKDGRGGRAFGYTLLALAVIAVFIIAALIARSAFDGSGGSQVAVPDVTGLTVGQATSELETAKLTLGTADAEGERHGARGQHHRPEPRGRHPGRRGSGGVGHRVDRGRRGRRSLPGRAVAGPGPAGAPGGQPGRRRHDVGAVGRAPQHRDQGQPQGGRDRPGRQQGRPRATPAARTRCPTWSAKDEGTARNMLEQAGFTVPNAQEQETADKPAGHGAVAVTGRPARPAGSAPPSRWWSPPSRRRRARHRHRPGRRHRPTRCCRPA